VPDNAETHEAALNGSAALDVLQAQAETADGFKDQYFAVCQRAEKAEAELRSMVDEARRATEAMEAAAVERDAAVQAAEQAARKAEAYDAARAQVKREGLSRAEYVLRVEAAEQAAEQAQAALRQIADYYEAEYQEGDKAYQAAIVARAALGNNT
jgi:hypothetical protein